MKLVQTVLAPAVFSIALLAQEAPATSPGTGGGQAQAAKVRSPEVLADGRVTFRILAPKATEVLVRGNWERGRDLAMTKDDSGLWSVTTPPLQPELWAYTFSVDGVRTLDPRITSLTKVAEELRSRKINLTFKSYPGEHEWRVWRHSLADMAPMLFR